jgi:hypothetical protein
MIVDYRYRLIEWMIERAGGLVVDGLDEFDTD